MDDQEKTVITANRGFYTAFDNADMTAMGEIWSAVHEISVVHPGWTPLYGREKVLSSWESILNNGTSPAISAAGERVHIMHDIAYVVCTEMLEQNELVATNIFIREGEDWKMVHHQAGLLAHSLESQLSVH